MTLRSTLANPATKAPYVRRLFSTIADRYDVATVALSWGRDQRWKARLVALAGPLAGRDALDVACGTGDIALRLSEAGAAHVVGLDVTPRMVAIAAGKTAVGRPPQFLVGDMSDLPFPSASFDLVTTGYGLRNVADLPRAVAEIARVLRPAGLFLSLDFDRPDNRVVRAVYHGYLTAVGSVLGWALHRDAETYRYIPESIRHYPAAGGVAVLLSRHGFEDVRWQPVLGGLLAIHRARRVSGG